MRPKVSYNAYLSGERFANDLVFELEYEPGEHAYRGRIAMLCDMFKGKRVIHVGCVDHNIEMISAKIGRRKWLHAELLKVCDRVAGVDINRAGIESIKNELGIDDVHCLDMTSDDLGLLEGEAWDTILLGELIEHIDNPVQFLTDLRTNTAGLCENVILTTPNGLHTGSVMNRMAGREGINSDHRYLFTPYTLTKVLSLAGYETTRITTCRNGIVKRRSFLKNAFYNRFSPVTFVPRGERRRGLSLRQSRGRFFH